MPESAQIKSTFPKPGPASADNQTQEPQASTSGPFNFSAKILVGVLVIFLVVLIVVVWLIANKRSNLPEASKAPPASQTRVDEGPKLEVSPITIIMGALANSGESGRANLKEVSGKTIITLDLKGAAESVSQPAHIHDGTCGQIGIIRQPLTSLVSGKSETTIDLGLQQLVIQGPLVIAVHKSEAESETYVTCGELHPTLPLAS